MLLNCGVGKTPESPLDSKEIKPVHPKGNQSWILNGRTDAEVEASILWPLDVANWLTGKDPDMGKDRRQQERGTTEDEIVGWHHQPDGHEFGCTLGVDDGQGGLAYCNSWGHKELDMTEQLNWTELNWTDIWIWELDHNKGWVLNRCFQIVVLDKSLESFGQ